MFSRKILWQCLTFGAVYTITKSIYVFSIKGSEYIHFFASPFTAVTANRSGPRQDLINVTNLERIVTKRERSHQNVTDREETYKRP